MNRKTAGYYDSRWECFGKYLGGCKSGITEDKKKHCQRWKCDKTDLSFCPNCVMHWRCSTYQTLQLDQSQTIGLSDEQKQQWAVFTSRNGESVFHCFDTEHLANSFTSTYVGTSKHWLSINQNEIKGVSKYDPYKEDSEERQIHEDLKKLVDMATEYNGELKNTI